MKLILGVGLGVVAALGYVGLMVYRGYRYYNSDFDDINWDHHS